VPHASWRICNAASSSILQKVQLKQYGRAGVRHEAFVAKNRPVSSARQQTKAGSRATRTLNRPGTLRTFAHCPVAGEPVRGNRTSSPNPYAAPARQPGVAVPATSASKSAPGTEWNGEQPPAGRDQRQAPGKTYKNRTEQLGKWEYSGEGGISERGK